MVSVLVEQLLLRGVTTAKESSDLFVEDSSSGALDLVADTNDLADVVRHSIVFDILRMISV